MRHSLLIAGLAAVILQGPALAQQVDIGVASSVTNRVQGSVGARALKTGDRIFQNENIETGVDSRSQLLFRDETVLNVAPESRVTLDRFVYDPARGGSGAAVTVTRGALRFISGNMPSQSYEIRTPAGSIGVRGTIVDVIVYENGEVVLQLVEGALSFIDGSGATVSLSRPGEVYILVPGQPGTKSTTLRPKDRRRLAGLNTAITLDELLPRPPELPRNPASRESQEPPSVTTPPITGGSGA
jgi:ferric-dicitrate binding protein FerR (iron transport regulator)